MLVDSLHRYAYQAGHAVARQWWRLCRPRSRGVAVAVWWQGRLLVVRPSYRPGYDLPGGGLRKGEEPRYGAVRELAEELAVAVPPPELAELGLFTFTLEHRRIRETLFVWRPMVEPSLRIDRREIVWAGFVRPAVLDTAAMTPSVRHALRRLPPLTER